MHLSQMVYAKVAAFGAFAVDTALVLAQSPSLPSTPSLVGGGAAGAGVSVALWWVYKEKVDRLERVVDAKADVKDLHPIKERLDQIHGDVQMLVRREMGERPHG